MIFFFSMTFSLSHETRYKVPESDVTLLELVFGSVAAMTLLASPVTSAPMPAVSPVLMV